MTWANKLSEIMFTTLRTCCLCIQTWINLIMAFNDELKLKEAVLINVNLHCWFFKAKANIILLHHFFLFWNRDYYVNCIFLRGNFLKETIAIIRPSLWNNVQANLNPGVYKVEWEGRGCSCSFISPRHFKILLVIDSCSVCPEVFDIITRSNYIFQV